MRLASWTRDLSLSRRSSSNAMSGISFSPTRNSRNKRVGVGAEEGYDDMKI